jgi:hypothetical protein
MALIIREALDCAIPSSAAVPPMTPEDNRRHTYTSPRERDC